MKRFLLFSALIIGGMLLYLKGSSQHDSLSNSLDEEIHLSNIPKRYLSMTLSADGRIKVLEGWNTSQTAGYA